MTEDEQQPAERNLELRRAFVWTSYLWLAAGLGITVLVDLVCGLGPVGRWFGDLGFGFYLGAFVVECVLALAFWGVVKKSRAQAGVAVGMLLVFAVATGVCLRWLFSFYSFGAVAGMFGLVGGYGLIRKPRVEKWKWVGLTLVVGLVLGTVGNVIWAVGAFGWAATYIIVLIFVTMVGLEFDQMWQVESRGHGPVHVALRIYLDLVVGFYRIVAEIIAGLGDN